MRNTWLDFGIPVVVAGGVVGGGGVDGVAGVLGALTSFPDVEGEEVICFVEPQPTVMIVANKIARVRNR
jgi:hypothetical protein